MSTTTPPDDQPRRFGYTLGGANFARSPVPGNAEFAVFLLVWLVIALIWIFSDQLDAAAFATLTVALTFAYLLSRCIAKASRVLED